MSQDPRHPGKEVLATLALPLSVELTVAVSTGIETAVTELGYTDVVVLTDGPGWRIAATPPGRRSDDADEQPHSVPPPAEEGAPTAPTT